MMADCSHLRDHLVHQTHLETDELVDLLVPGGQSVQDSRQLDGLLGYRERHQGTPAFLHFL